MQHAARVHVLHRAEHLVHLPRRLRLVEAPLRIHDPLEELAAWRPLDQEDVLRGVEQVAVASHDVRVAQRPPDLLLLLELHSRPRREVGQCGHLGHELAGLLLRSVRHKLVHVGEFPTSQKPSHGEHLSLPAQLMSADEPIASGRRRDAVRWRDRLSRGVRVARVRREADAQGEAAHCAVSTPRFPWAVYPTRGCRRADLFRFRSCWQGGQPRGLSKVRVSSRFTVTPKLDMIGGSATGARRARPWEAGDSGCLRPAADPGSHGSALPAT